MAVIAEHINEGMKNQNFCMNKEGRKSERMGYMMVTSVYRC